MRNLLLRRDLVPLPNVVDPDLVIPANRDDVVTRDARKRGRRERLGVAEQRDDRLHGLRLRSEVENPALAFRIWRDEQVTLDRMQ